MRSVREESIVPKTTRATTEKREGTPLVNTGVKRARVGSIFLFIGVM